MNPFSKLKYVYVLLLFTLLDINILDVHFIVVYCWIVSIANMEAVGSYENLYVAAVARTARNLKKKLEKIKRRTLPLLSFEVLFYLLSTVRKGSILCLGSNKYTRINSDAVPIT